MDKCTYYLLNDPEFDKYPRYIELDQAYYCLREIVDFGGECKNTSLYIEDEFFISEGSWEECLGDIEDYQISKEVFEEKWQLSLKNHLAKWHSLKARLAIGQFIKAKIVVFYPQGIILDMGECFYGIADYELCKENFGLEKIKIHQLLDLKVVGFDEVNLWVRVEPKF